jgi:uncharacterized membrane protein
VPPKATLERVSAFSDGVFAILITVLVLELRPPEQPTFKALGQLWPTWISYAVSYLFIATVWANHHYVLRYASEATPRLLWFNFGHLFSMSLLPFSTAWMAVSELAPQLVAFYAAVFFLVNATYLLLIWELIDAGEQVRRGCAESCISGPSRLFAPSQSQPSSRSAVRWSGSEFVFLAWWSI